MGFLKKDWDYENPAEHNMEQQEEERKDRKLWLWGLALICGGLSIYALYHIENTIYGGAIDTGWAGWAGTFTGLLIVACFGGFFQPKEKEEHKWDKAAKIGGGILLVILVVFLFAACWKMPSRRVYGLQFLALLSVAFGVDKAQKAEVEKNVINTWNFMMTFVLLTLITFAAPKILGMTSVTEGEKLLRAEGYQEVYFDNKTQAAWLGKEMMAQVYAKLPQELEREFVYLYGCVKEDISYGILVDPYGQGILAVEESLPGTEVYDWLSN